MQKCIFPTYFLFVCFSTSAGCDGSSASLPSVVSGVDTFLPLMVRDNHSRPRQILSFFRHHVSRFVAVKVDFTYHLYGAPRRDVIDTRQFRDYGDGIDRDNKDPKYIDILEGRRVFRVK
jgi:hypothetical protein